MNSEAGQERRTGLGGHTLNGSTVGQNSWNEMILLYYNQLNQKTQKHTCICNQEMCSVGLTYV